MCIILIYIDFHLPFTSNFQVMTTDGGSELVFHSLHKQFLQLAQHAYETLKKQNNEAYSLHMIARWGERDVQLFYYNY